MSDNEVQTVFIRSLYEAAIEVLGASDSGLIFSAIVNWDGPGEIQKINNKPQFLSDLGNEFAIRYERNTAKGLLLRIGESSFMFLQKNIKSLSELGSIENRLVPISNRFENSLVILAENLSAISGLEIISKKKNKKTFCLAIGGKNTIKMFSSDLHLFYFAGLLRAFCVWMDSRKEYDIQVSTEADVRTGGKFVCFRYENSAL